jgi:cytochrome c556
MERIEIALTLAVLGFCGATLASQGQAVQTQPPPAQPPRPAAPAPQPFVPVAANTLAINPDAYVGRTVSVTAAVDRRFGATAFSVDQDKVKSAGQDVLVLAPLLTAPVEPDAYVTVIGEAVRFDSATVAARMKDTMPALAPDVAAKYEGRAAIIAVSVINNAMTDLAKRLPPPMTPDEEALSKLMKQIGPGFNALRQAVTGTNAADAGAQSAGLTKLFTDTAAFWKSKPHPDAIQWNDEARRTAEAIAAAAGRADWDAVKADVPKLQQTCSSCHGQYRERLDDGSYRFRQAAR